MQEYDIDTDRLPLGQLSKHQVQMGYDVLERLRDALKTTPGSTVLEKLSSEFYQVRIAGSQSVMVLDNGAEFLLQYLVTTCL